MAHSKALQKLAQEISTFDGPFDKIKQMIQKMIFRLMSEQKDEDDHKNWCDMEMEKSTESKEDKDEKVKMLTKKVAEHDAAIKKLIKQITENNDKAADITKYMEEETELRNENHAEIEATIKDSQDAQAAVTQATQVLKDFYKESGMVAKEPWEFVQISSHRGVDLPDSPDTWDSSYTGVTDPENGADGVLALLDGVMTKFSAMEADAKVQDETDQQNYEKDMQAKKISLEETKQDTSMKTTKKDSLQEKMEGLQGQLKHTTSEFDAVVQYLKDLQPACGEGDSSYEDRKKARADEITALRKAQTILEDAFRAKAFLQK
jgi:chromosome segregation ATPase